MKTEVMWVEKYRPQKIAEIIGNEEAKTSFINWLKNNQWRKKAALLYGPPGVGKSTLVQAAASEFNYRIIEMNASDTRTEKSIHKIAGPALTTLALETFSSNTVGNLLFLDEVDGIYGREDRGGVGAILKIFKPKKPPKKDKRKTTQQAQIPIVLAANNPDIQKLRPLRKICHLVRFRKVRIPLIVTLLQKICLIEHIEASIDALNALAQNSQGDVRSAITDLQALSEDHQILRIQDITKLGPRNRDLHIYDTLKGVFSAKSTKEALAVLNKSTIKYDDLTLSIHDNLPYRYKDPIELGVAYDFLSRADVFRGRIGVENWILLKYFFNLTAQTTTISAQVFQPFEFIYPPIRILTLFWTKGKRTTLQTICSKIAANCHVSQRSAKTNFVPFLKALQKEQKESPIFKWFKLDDKEINHLAEMNPL